MIRNVKIICKERGKVESPDQFSQFDPSSSWCDISNHHFKFQFCDIQAFHIFACHRTTCHNTKSLLTFLQPNRKTWIKKSIIKEKRWTLRKKTFVDKVIRTFHTVKMMTQRQIFVLVIILLTLTNSSLSSYSIDDGILFRLNFQPSETTTTSGTDASSTEKSSVPADESLLGTNPSDDFETVLISTSRNEMYHCSLPKSDSKAAKVKISFFDFHHLPQCLAIIKNCHQIPQQP